MTERIIGTTKYSKGSSIEKPTRLILKSSDDGFVTRFQTKDGMEFWGSYYRVSLNEAKEKFRNRVKEHNKDYTKGNVSHTGNKITWK